MYTYSFPRWREVTGEAIDPMSFPAKGLDDLLQGPEGQPIRTPESWATKREDIRRRMLWVMGELPTCGCPSEVTLARKEEYDRVYRFRSDGGLCTDRLALDEKLVLHLTHAKASAGSLPVAIYCHAYNDQRGFAWHRNYGWGTSVGERLAQQGFAAVEFDQFGYGTRNRDCDLGFFARNPRQSALGVMVQDVRRIVDMLALLEFANAEQVVLVGYSLGGAVALHAGALDERIRAVEGLGRYSHLRPTLPRLGFFVGRERRVPYDYHEVLALIAPRPVLIVAPALDQDWFPEDVLACCSEASRVYRLLGHEDALQVSRPHDSNRYPPVYQDQVNAWLRCQLKA